MDLSEKTCYIAEIEHIVAEQNRLAQRCRLKDIMAALSYEAASDEDHVGYGVKIHKLSDSIKYEHII